MVWEDLRGQRQSCVTQAHDGTGKMRATRWPGVVVRSCGRGRSPLRQRLARQYRTRTLASIADEVGSTSKTVRRRLVAAGVEIRTAASAAAERRRRELDVNPQQVRAALRRHGLPIRSHRGSYRIPSRIVVARFRSRSSRSARSRSTSCAATPEGLLLSRNPTSVRMRSSKGSS